MGQGDPSYQKESFTKADPTTLERERELWRRVENEQQRSGNNSSYWDRRFNPSGSTSRQQNPRSEYPYRPAFNPSERGGFSDETTDPSLYDSNIGIGGHGIDAGVGYRQNEERERNRRHAENLGLTGGGEEQNLPMGITAYQNILGQNSEAAKLARHETQNQRFEEGLNRLSSENAEEFGGRSQVLQAQALGEHQRASNLIDVEEDQRLVQNQLAAAEGLAESDQIYATQERFNQMTPYEKLEYMNRLKGTTGTETHKRKVGPWQQGLGMTLASAGLLGDLSGAYKDFGLDFLSSGDKEPVT